MLAYDGPSTAFSILTFSTLFLVSIVLLRNIMYGYVYSIADSITTTVALILTNYFFYSYVALNLQTSWPVLIVYLFEVAFAIILEKIQ